MIFNVTGGGAGSGGTLVVTAPAGVTCTVSKDGKTKSKTVDQYGYATFKGLDSGTWTVVITDGSQTSPARQVVVTADYDVTMSFFSASIVVTYPEGSTCTCSDGATTLTAPDTSGSHTFVVSNAGTWTVSCTDGDSTDSQAVTITTNGESQSVALGYTLWLYKDGVFHDTYTMSGAKVYNNSTYTGTYDPNVTNADGVLTLYTTKTGKAGTSIGYATDNKIDMSKYSTLEIDITSITWGTGMNGALCVATARAGYIPSIALASIAISKDTTIGELTLDISEVNDEAYVVICIPDMATYNAVSFASLSLYV